jgi:hypothetical protein
MVCQQRPDAKAASEKPKMLLEFAHWLKTTAAAGAAIQNNLAAF